MLRSRVIEVTSALVALSLAAAVAIAAPPTGSAGSAGSAGSTGSIAEGVLAALRAANVARADNAREAQAWTAEQERVRLVLATIDQQIAQLRAEQRAHRRAMAALEAKNVEAAPERGRARAIEALAAEQAQRIDDALDALAGQIPPGVIPTRVKSAGTDPLTTSLLRLEQAERGAGSAAVELVTGRLDGSLRSVELLRIGGAVAWWRSLDGEEAGTARVVDGIVRLTPTTSSTQAEAIGTACDIAKGRKAPAVVVLPVEHARTWVAGAERPAGRGQ